MNQRELFQLLEAKNDEDILRHFPSRYEDLKPTIIPNPIPDGYRAVVKGTIKDFRNIPTRSNSLMRFKVAVLGGNLLSCMLYSQPFYLSKLSSGKELLLVMYYSEKRHCFIVSSIHDLDSFAVMTGLKPVYNLPKGVSPSYFSNYVKKVLSYPRAASYMISKLPTRLVEKYRFINEFDAYRAIHLPRNSKDLSEGLRVFKYEEALSYCIRSLHLKKQANERKRKEDIYIDHNKINDFIKRLSYKLTQDQIAAIREIVLDLEKDRVMYRLLQGDVGTGKTIVSFVALYANYLRHKQGVLMAPTFELAMQHFHNAEKVFANYPIKIAFLSGSGKAKEKKEILQGLEDGSIDILISTHAAAGEKVAFQSLGLTIVDEQQLFGVEQREKLLSKGESSDLLMMSATPIPRTLSQIIHADLDVSTLTQFPHGTRNVKTVVLHSSDPYIFKAMDKALEAKRQVFIVAPKIEDGTNNASSAESVYQDIVERYGKERVQLLHGRIKKETQDEIIARFVSNEKPILVSTTVIQVGIDVTSAGLLIIYDANYFGLSTLHQLRGRIGRSGDFALAILIYDGQDKDAQDKLKFLESSEDGLQISQFDLKQRGSGTYSGTNQSGKSDLAVCNFVEDLRMFEYAKKDAQEILEHPEEAENLAYLKTIDQGKEFKIA